MNGLPSGAYSSQDTMKEKRPHGYEQFAINQYDPAQMALYKQGFAHVGPESFTSKLAMGDQGAFAEMEAPALRQFGELQGNIASRFSGMGMGGRKSSGFQNTMSSASQDFASQLQSQRQDLRRQAILDLMGMSNQILGQRPQEKGLVQKPEKQKSGWGSIIGTGVGATGGFFAGGPAGALQGAKLGYDVGSQF
jgi:hypothetical protein